MNTFDERRHLGRGTAIGLLTGAVGTFLGSRVLGASAEIGGAACTTTPEGEIGPYFTDDSPAAFNRSAIVSNVDGSGRQPGIPLTLHVRVSDTKASCGPISGAQIDIWHCNALGVYSGEASEGTASQTWLRGEQLTDAHGMVTFRTIIPGWYQGRATHIHLRIRSKYGSASSTDDGSNTTQLFFPQAAIDTIHTRFAPYSARGANPTTNAADHVYRPQTGGRTELSLSGSASTGFIASAVIGLPITES